MAFRLPRLNLTAAITSDGAAPSSVFQRWWQSVVEAIEGQESTQDETLLSIQQALNQINAALATANAAIALASAPPSGSTVEGSASSSVTILDTWTNGPTVALTGVAAGDFTANGTFIVASSSASLTGGHVYDGNGSQYAAGEFRIVELAGPTTIYPAAGSATLTAVSYIYPGYATTVIYFDDPAALAAFTTALGTSGALSYRLELKMEAGVTFGGCDATLFVHRL